MYVEKCQMWWTLNRLWIWSCQFLVLIKTMFSYDCFSVCPQFPYYWLLVFLLSFSVSPPFLNFLMIQLVGFWRSCPVSFPELPHQGGRNNSFSECSTRGAMFGSTLGNTGRTAICLSAVKFWRSTQILKKSQKSTNL